MIQYVWTTYSGVFIKNKNNKEKNMWSLQNGLRVTASGRSTDCNYCQVQVTRLFKFNN